MQQKHGIAAAAILLHCALACGEESDRGADAARTTSPKQLDLRAPDVRSILTAEQIAAAVGATSDRTIDEVEVEGVRPRAPPVTPAVWSGPFAVFWALAHPTQAWRILAPIPPDRTRDFGPPPDSTHPNKEPATGIPRMAGE